MCSTSGFADGLLDSGRQARAIEPQEVRTVRDATKSALAGAPFRKPKGGKTEAVPRVPVRTLVIFGDGTRFSGKTVWPFLGQPAQEVSRRHPKKRHAQLAACCHMVVEHIEK